MKPYKIFEGDMLKILPTLEENSFDACITDPPYELNFMNKGWDNSGIAFQKETWQKVLRVLKPGAYLLAFGGSRTFHRIACAIEDAGFEIRDTIMWLYGSGFPKSMNIGLAVDKKNGVESEIIGINKSVQDLQEVGKITGHKMTFGQEGTENCKRKDVPIYKALNEWDGWGTNLKPAYEPIIVARKPCEGSITDNVLKYGVGGINIDACRVGDNGGVKKVNIEPNSGSKNSGFGCNGDLIDLDKGRYPSNVILTYDDTDFEEVCGQMADRNEEEHPCRYFYCAKASKKDRDEGLEEFELIQITDGSIRTNVATGRKFGGTPIARKNFHPTVKPVELMQYLIRLVLPGGGYY